MIFENRLVLCFKEGSTFGQRKDGAFLACEMIPPGTPKSFSP
jgi:hypothetical protein